MALKMLKNRLKTNVPSNFLKSVCA